MMIVSRKRCGRKYSWRCLMYYSAVCLEEQRKTMNDHRLVGFLLMSRFVFFRRLITKRPLLHGILSQFTPVHILRRYFYKGESVNGSQMGVKQM
jgi:hypothetical protein